MVANIVHTQLIDEEDDSDNARNGNATSWDLGVLRHLFPLFVFVLHVCSDLFCCLCLCKTCARDVQLLQWNMLCTRWIWWSFLLNIFSVVMETIYTIYNIHISIMKQAKLSLHLNPKEYLGRWEGHVLAIFYFFAPFLPPWHRWRGTTLHYYPPHYSLYYNKIAF